MKIAVISYHKDAYTNYPLRWLKGYVRSIESQTNKDYLLFEINYGEGVGFLFWKSTFLNKKFPTFVDCMNFLLNWLFIDCGYDYVFNTNVDDLYDVKWIEKTLAQMQKGYDLVSCNFKLIDEFDGVTHTHQFEKLDLKKELAKNHNIICHPGVCYSKKFWTKYGPYESSEIPFEDMKLWQRAVARGAKIFIQPEHLVLHRVHENSVCKSNNR